MADEFDEQGGDAACWAAQFDDPAATRVVVRGVDAADAIGQRIAVDATAAAARADVDLWLPAIAPSPSLAAWCGDRPDRWDAFRAAYARELAEPPRAAALAMLERLARQGPIVLTTSAADPSRSAAEVARAALTERLRADRT